MASTARPTRRGGRPTPRRRARFVRRVPVKSHDADDRWRVYLLEQQAPRAPRTPRAYIGATVDVAHRVRQHNGDIAGGARRTTRASGAGATWRLVAVARGFGSQHEALSFEWWAHRGTRRKTHGEDAVAECMRVMTRQAALPRWGGRVTLALT